jgi:cytochrome c
MPGGIVRSVASGVMLTLLFAAAEPARGEDGRALLERNCGRCHALSESAASPLTGAPNLWAALRSYEQEQLEFELSEGIGSRHSDMPQIQFSSEEISSIHDYLFSRTKRMR